jgi:hypothetical protein
VKTRWLPSDDGSFGEASFIPQQRSLNRSAVRAKLIHLAWLVF